VSPEIQSDLELLSLFKTCDLSFKQKELLLEPFLNDSSLSLDIDDEIMFNIANPNLIAYSLFGDRISVLCNRQHTEYEGKFVDGSDTTLATRTTKEEAEKKNADFLDYVLKSPNFSRPPFNSGQEHLFHMKFERLLTDFYGVNFQSIEGLAVVDSIVHTYDVSPGEDNIERCHAFPIPAHTYDELPIIKYDGYDECLIDPKHDEPVDHDISAYEDQVRSLFKELAEQVAKNNGTPVIELSAFKEKNILSPEQFAVLRTILHNVSDEERLRLYKKTWSLVLPNSEIDALFTGQYERLKDAQHGHH